MRWRAQAAVYPWCPVKIAFLFYLKEEWLFKIPIVPFSACFMVKAPNWITPPPALPPSHA